MGVLTGKDKLLQYTKIYNTCRSLVKKMDKENMYYQIIALVKQLSNYSLIDKALECFINELIYDGYSLKYLDHWFNDNIANNELTELNINEILDRFPELKKKKEIFTYYISILSSLVNDNEEGVPISYDIKLKKLDFDDLVLYDNKTEIDYKKYLQYSNDYNIYETKIAARDVYKGIELIVNAIDSYFQIIKYIANENKSIILDKAIVLTSLKEHIKIRIEPYDENILFSHIEQREREDIKDFIKYRDSLYKNEINSDEIVNLQKSQKNQLQENRLINLWAVIEYILTFHEGTSIIGKVKEIVPKLICLYIIKDKLNIFWGRLNNYRNANINIVNDFFKECKSTEEDYYYDLHKLIEFIVNNKEKIIEQFKFNDILNRDILEIGLLLTNHEMRIKYIKSKHDEVFYDLIRIYRDRNIIIHSGKRRKLNYNYEALRLYQYCNSLLGVIIYYKNKNPYSTIPEILNSIVHTYDEYMKVLSTVGTPHIYISKPKYLFIG